MASSDIQSLLDSSYCINNFGPGGWPLIELGLLKQWAVAANASAVTDPAALLASAACFNNYSAQAWLIKLGLEKNILAGLSASTPSDAQSLLDTSACANNFAGTIALQDLVLLTRIVLLANPSSVTDPAALIALGSCYNNYSSQAWLLRFGLLAQISLAVNPSASVEPADLLASAQCYNCYGPGIWPLLEVQLLNLIFTNGGLIPPILAPVITQVGNVLSWSYAGTLPPFWVTQESSNGISGWVSILSNSSADPSWNVDSTKYHRIGGSENGVTITGTLSNVAGPENLRITEAGDFRVTEAGDFRAYN